MLRYWAAAKVKADGTVVNRDQIGAITRTGLGIYTLVLDNALGATEACPVITPLVFGGVSFGAVAYEASLGADTVTLTVNFFGTTTGLPADTGFCMVVSRFEAS